MVAGKSRLIAQGRELPAPLVKNSPVRQDTRHEEATATLTRANIKSLLYKI